MTAPPLVFVRRAATSPTASPETAPRAGAFAARPRLAAGGIDSVRQEFFREFAGTSAGSAAPASARPGASCPLPSGTLRRHRTRWN